MPCGGVDVGIDEPAHLRVVITAVQVIESRLGVVVVASVAEGVEISRHPAVVVGDGAVAPGVVAVGRHELAGGRVHQSNNVALQVVDVVVHVAAVDHAHARSRAVVEKPANVAALVLRQDLRPVQEVGRGCSVDRLLRADPVGIIGVGVAVRPIAQSGQLTSLPGVGVAVVGLAVADRVVGDRIVVVARQQVAPGTVVIAVIDRRRRSPQRPRRVSIFLALLDVARVITVIYFQYGAIVFSLHIESSIIFSISSYHIL